jgi:hypothetical protein
LPLILLILSLVNLTSLILTHGTPRTHDLAVRTAIGAGRLRRLENPSLPVNRQNLIMEAVPRPDTLQE